VANDLLDNVTKTPEETTLITTLITIDSSEGRSETEREQQYCSGPTHTTPSVLAAPFVAAVGWVNWEGRAPHGLIGK